MPIDAFVAFGPRKRLSKRDRQPRCSRFFESNIQVLLSHERLTTTQVAERADVSVGTLYQYDPNEQSLLFAVLENHFNNVESHGNV